MAHHLVNPEREYRQLQKRLDRNVSGAPASPLLTKILKLLFTPEQATVARRLPTRPTPLDELSRKLDIPQEDLADRLEEMAGRGLVIDLMHDEKRYFSLPPVVIGLFEYTFMRTGEDIAMKGLALLFDQYMNENDRFARAVFDGQTQIGRSMVREEALPEESHTEILDWERASHIVESADLISVGMCSCHHKKQHLGEACNRPQKVCLSFGLGADMLIRNGMAEPVTTREGMRILEQAKSAGLAQTADNVQRDMSYMCNCCGCCCGMMQAIRTFDIQNAIVSSNWIMDVDRSQCNGCGDCVDTCPVRAISLEVGKIGKKKRRWAVRDEALCLGCGSCYPTCKYGGDPDGVSRAAGLHAGDHVRSDGDHGHRAGQTREPDLRRAGGTGLPGARTDRQCLGELASREGRNGDQAITLRLPERTGEEGFEFLARSRRGKRRLEIIRNVFAPRQAPS